MLKKLEMVVDDNVVLTECFDITVYVRHSFHDVRKGVMNFYQESMKVIGPSVGWYYTETMGRAKKVTPKVLDMVPFWFSPGTKVRSIYQMTLRSGKHADEITPVRFQLFASDTKPGEKPTDDRLSDTGILRLTLPPEAADDPERLITLTKALVRSLPFVSGHAGYGLVWEEKDLDPDVLNRIRAWARRYPGLDVFGFLSVENLVVTGIKSVNWLTLINDDAVAKLGGVAALKRKLKVPVVVHSIPGGVIIQAGPAPSRGDVNKGETLPVYRQVARALAPVREQPDPDEIYPFVGNENATVDWLARFEE